MKEEKDLFLKALSVDCDVLYMKQELHHLRKKYPENRFLQDFFEINENYYTKTIKITQEAIQTRQENNSDKEVETYLLHYEAELNEIETWLNDVVKEYLKNNFLQKDLIAYFFEDGSKEKTIDSKVKEIFLMSLSISDDLNSMRKELYHLGNKYPNDLSLKDFLKISISHSNSPTIQMGLPEIKKFKMKTAQKNF